MIEFDIPIKTVAGERWTDNELARLIEAYANKDKPVGLAILAAELGRNKTNICRKARSLGLTNKWRAKVQEKKPARKYATSDELKAAQSAAAKDRILKNGHPRGSLGLIHSPQTRAKLSERSKTAWANPNSKFHAEEFRQAKSDRMTKMIASGRMNQGYSRARGGKRADLGGVYFRSAWEANYARYLNMLIKQGEIAAWEFEPKTFEFTNIKRGTRAYTPDFKVIGHDGQHVWHEVKGWMDAKSKTRLARFARYYPNEKLILVDSKWFKSANKTLKGVIQGWEDGTVHV